MVESESDTILANAENINVAFLVVGDPYGYVTMLKYKLTGMKQTCI
jgi:diphthamide biosynthesis methyltransferase